MQAKDDIDPKKWKELSGNLVDEGVSKLIIEYLKEN